MNIKPSRIELQQCELDYRFVAGRINFVYRICVSVFITTLTLPACESMLRNLPVRGL